MMIGHNEIHFNPATMQGIVQEYMKRTIINFTGFVESVTYDASSNMFVVTILHKEESGS